MVAKGMSLKAISRTLTRSEESGQTRAKLDKLEKRRAHSGGFGNRAGKADRAQYRSEPASLRNDGVGLAAHPPPVAFATAAMTFSDTFSISASVSVFAVGCRVTSSATDFLASPSDLPSNTSKTETFADQRLSRHRPQPGSWRRPLSICRQRMRNRGSRAAGRTH